MIFLLLALLSSSVPAIFLKYLNSSSPNGVYFVNYIICALLAFATMEPKTLYNNDITPCWPGGITGLLYLIFLSANEYSIYKMVPSLLRFYMSGGTGTHSVVCDAVWRASHRASGAGHSAGGGCRDDEPTSTKIRKPRLRKQSVPDATGPDAIPQWEQRRHVPGIYPVGPSAGRRAVYVFAFLFAGLATLALLVKEHRSLTVRDIFFRVPVGIPNFLSSRLPCLPVLQCGGNPGHQRNRLLP